MEKTNSNNADKRGRTNLQKSQKINISKESSKQNAENQLPEKTSTHFSTKNTDFENFLRIQHATITNHDWLHHLRCPGPLQIHILSFK